MKKGLLQLLVLAFLLGTNVFAQEGTKQFMPSSSDRLWLEFNVFDNVDFGTYGCPEDERINIRLNSGEKLYFGMRMNTTQYSSDVYTDYRYVSFRIKDQSGNVVFAERRMVTTGETGYISNYTQAITGPNGVKLNGVTITGGYTPLTYTAASSGDFYIEFQYWRYTYGTSGNSARTRRFALQYFDMTVTDASGNIITNPGSPNVSAGRLWSNAWQMTTTSYTQYPVNSYFYVFTSDEFINKINFQFYPFSFVFQSNSYGLITPATESNYIKRAQSKDNDQTANASEYRIFVNDPDRSIWPNTRLVPPKVQVWADDTLFYDFSYNRTPQELTLTDKTIFLEKNRVGCEYSSIAIFKINSSINGFTAILLDLDGDGSYSTTGSDRVIYWDMLKGNNYILWNFKTDAGAEAPVGTYKASATFLGRGPTNFPVYDVEQLDGVQTSAIRPFKKLNTSIYWDDTYISRWGDETGDGLMDETQRKQLVINKRVPRIWSWNAALENINFNGNKNTMNTWFNAIDLGYSEIIIKVSQSDTKCVNGLAPYVGDIYKDGLPNNTVTFAQLDFTKKFFDPIEDPLTQIRVLSLPANGVLKLSGTAVTINQIITAANLSNLAFTPNTGYVGRASFDYDAKNSQYWSMNQEKVYITINTPPTISSISDQNLCTNTPSPAIPFTVNDAETLDVDLVVTAFSADPTFVPNSSIVIGGSGANRTVTVTPVANKSGSAIVYVMVDDGYSEDIQEFAVYVGPDLEFSGDTSVCVDQDLYLVAQETGATSYTWKEGTTTKGTSKILSLTAGSFSAGNWSLTVVKDGCTSTRYFEVVISPLTTFTGDPNVCVGEEIALSAVENNASYIWRKGTTVVSTIKQFYKGSAALTDDGSDYTLEVTKSGCNATSDPFSISVINQPNIGLTITGSTVDPGKNGTITIASAQSGIKYNVYKDDVFVTSGNGTGSNLVITISSANLIIGSNVFVVKADNNNCEIPMSTSATITVRQPGITVSSISGNTSEPSGAATFTIVLNTEPSADVSISFNSSDITEGTVSPATVTFTPLNWSAARTITVTGVDDYVVDGNITYTVEISAASSSDLNYNGINPNDITLSNIDNDAVGITVTPTSGLTTTELGGTATFAIRLTSQPVADVSISVSSSNTLEGTVSPVTIILNAANWNSPQPVTITGVDDKVDDGDVLYTIITSNTSSSDPLYNGLSVADVSVTNINDDIAGVVVTPTSGLTTTEGGGTANFTIKLNSKPTQNVLISLSSSNTNEGNVSPASITFTPSDWDNAQTVTVTGVNDDVDDGNISYTIITSNVSSTDTKYSNMDVADVSVVNTDDDTAGITVSPTSGLITTEAGGTATFTIRLNSKPTANVTIGLSSSDTGEGVISPATLLFTSADWGTPKTVTVSGVDDFVDDNDQNYTIVTTNASSTDTKYSNMDVADVSVTNQDNDAAGIIVSPTSGLTTNESGGTATFTIVLASQPTSNVTIGLSSSNTLEGTVSPTSVTFSTANWGAAQTVTVTGVNDAVADGPQVYTIITAAATSSDPLYNGINPSDVSVTNQDNDVAGITVTPTSLTTNESGSSVSFTIVLNTQPTASVAIGITSGNTAEGTVAPSTLSFTSLNWNTAQTVTVTPVNDDIDDGDISYSIVTGNAVSSDSKYSNRDVADVSVTNIDDDVAGVIVMPTVGLVTTEAGGTAIFTVKLNSKPTANVTISLSSSNTAEGIVSPTSLTFTPSNWSTAQPVTVTGVNDDVDDDNVNYTIVTSSALSSDTKYNGLSVADVAVTNNDNDVAGVTVTPTSGLVTTEAGGTATFTVKLNSKPLSTVTINLNSNNTNEGTVLPTSITLTTDNWNSTQTVTISGVDDNVDDDNVNYIIVTSNAISSDAKYNGIDVADVSVSNTDNDTAGITVTPIIGLTTTEAGGTATFTVVLNSQPTANVSIALSSSNTAEGTVSPASITFNSSNWNTAQTITITGVDDNVDDDNISYTIITAAAVSSDVKYNGINPNDVSVTNIDNDDAGITFNPIAGLITTEAGGTATFTCQLTTRPTANVSIALSSSNTAEGTISVSTLTFIPASWNTPQTITITGVDDNVVDGNIGYTIVTAAAVSSDTKYNGINTSDVSVTNNDNDVVGVVVNPFNGLFTTEAGGQASFTMRLSSQPIADVSITLNSSNPLEGTISPTTVTFTASNWNTNQPITVTGVDDYVDDDDVAYSIITQQAVSSDPLYDHYNAVDVSVINRDNDEAGYILSATNLTYTESDAPLSFTISLKSKPISDVQFNLTSGNTEKGTVSPLSLTFTSLNWNTPQTVTVTPADNYIVDGATTFSIITSAATSTDNKYNGLNPSDITITCNDDDIAGITVSSVSGNTSETGTTATFTVVLTSEPTDDVTIDISSSNTAEGTVSPLSVVFTSLDWNVAQTITVTGVDDALADGNQTYTIVLDEASSLDYSYNGLDPDDVLVINTDDDSPGVSTFPSTGLTTTEAGGVATFTIWLNTQPIADVPINFTSSNTSEGTVSPISVLFNDTNWNVPQTITLTGIDDLLEDGNQAYFIQMEVDASCVEPNYSGISISDVTAVNLDDVGPRPVNDNAITDEDTPATIDVLLNDLGLDKGGLIVTIKNQPTHGVAVVETNNAVTYTPNGLYNGIETFSYRVTDANGGYGEAIITVDVTFMNDVPVAVDDNRGTSINTPVVVDVLFNDYGLEDGGIVVSVSENADPLKGFAVSNPDNTVTFTPASGYLGIATFKYKITDANADESEATVTVNVRAVNHIPDAVNDNVTTILNTAKTINVLANDSGLDDGFGSLSIHSNPSHGAVVVNANRTVTYTPNTGFTGTDSFRYLLQDVDGDYDLATVTVTVTPKPDYQPVAHDDSRGTSKNTAVNVDVLVNDTGLEDGVANVSVTSIPVNGVAVVNGDFTITFTPNTDFIGTEIFGYQVCDSDGDCSTANVKITVKEGINYIPVAADDNAITIVNKSVSINVLGNDTGLDDGFGKLSIYTSPVFGSVVINANRTITYTPSYMFVGSETFKYMIEDIDGDYDIANVTVTVIERPDYLPVANDDKRGCSFNEAVIVDVLFNDTGLEDEPVVVSISQLPTQGTAVVNADNSVTFTPEAGFVGVMAFRYVVTDADGDSDDALVTIYVKAGINIVPLAKNDNATTIVNTPVEVNVLANDSGLGDGFGNLYVYSNPEFGTVSVNANRTITYAPSYMFVGSETFQYVIEDVDGDYSLATVTVTVTERPDYQPVANDDRRGCSFDTPVIVDVLVNDSGLNDEPITVSISQDPVQGLSIANSDNTVTFSPETGFVGIMTFRYTVTDADGDSDDALVTINVKSGINMIPVAVDDNAATLVNTPVDINVLANDSNLDDGFGGLTISTSPTHGTVVINENRTITYTPSYMFIGTETFQYKIEDVDGDYSIATVTVVVSERPDYQPVANDDRRGCSFNESVVVDVLFNDTGLNDEPVVVSISQTPSQGLASVNSDNTVAYTPQVDFIGTMTFRYTVTDADGDSDDALVTISVKEATNNVPLAVNDNSTTLINTPVDINVLANDSGLDDGFGNLAVHVAPSFGSVVVNANRTITYTPSYMFVGVETFEYMIEDIDGDYSVALVTVTVIDRPDYQPVANDDRRGCSFNTPVNIDVLFNDTGLNDSPITVSVSQAPSDGVAVANTDETVTYTPATDFVGEVTFRYTVTDVDGDSDDAQVTIRVKDGVNLVPIAVDDNASTNINTSVDINVLANDTNLEDGFGSLTIYAAPAFGIAIVNANRTITYTPSYMFIGSETFQYLVEDVDGDYSVATVTVTVTDRPDYQPVANDDYRGATYNIPRIVDVLINDTGLEDTPVVVTIASNPSNGTVAVNGDNTVTYTPDGSYLGLVEFNYTVTDNDGDSDNATVHINVKPKNMIPVAVDDIVTTLINTPVDIPVLDNDSLLYEGIKGLYIYSGPRWGTAVVNADNTITYTPSNWFIGNDEFVYYVEDVDGDYDIATVRITVFDLQNAIPVANDDRRGTSRNTPVDIDVLINDDGLDDGWIRVHIYKEPDLATGLVVVKTDNTVTFTPASDYLGEATFKYYITDRNNDTSNVANVTVMVKEINYVPIANLDTVSTVMNLPVLIDVVENDTGLEDGLDYIRLMNKPLHGFAYVFDNRNIKYFPSSWFIGTDSLTYMVVDSDGDYGIATVIITVKDRIDHKPKANPDSRGTVKNHPVNVDVLFNDTGLEDGGLTLVLSNMPAHGSVVLNDDNTVTYTPATDYLGVDVFYYQVCDFDSDCSSAAVTINVKDDNLVPIAVNDTVTTYKNKSVVVPVLYNDKNLGDGGVSVNVYINPLNGIVEVNPDESITYTPSTDFFGIDSLWYVVSDIDGDYSLAKVVVEVLNKENAVPEAFDDQVETFIDVEVLINVLDNDLYLTDGVKSVEVVIMPINGNCTIDYNNRILYTPLSGYKGDDSFTYRVCDMDDDCDEALVSISVIPDESKKIDIPDAFSPNGDHINDTFELLNLVNYGRVTLKVYNRWGNLVYKNNSYKNDWDGTSNASMAIGSKLPDGTYYYIIEIVETGKMYKGSVFIKR
ncbi:MAG: Ig-like domain-containing protein [Bacteroidales bacterium]